jgi:hypothetical protein
MNITTTKSHSASNGVKIILTGASGFGKTRAVSHLIKEGFKPLFISAESGTQSLKEFEIPMIDISTNDKGEPVPMEKRFSRLGEVFKFLKEGQHKFDTIYIDSLTEINKCLIAELKAKPEYQDPKNTLKLYGENAEIMLKLARAFRDLPLNVVLVCLQSVEKDEIGKRYITADLVGKVADHLPPLYDIILNLQIVEQEGKKIQRFQCQAGDNIVAKDRTGQLNFYEEYDLGKLFKKVKGVK